MRVLCVDDDRVNLMLFEHACAAFGALQLSTAADGAEALAEARRVRPELLVIDLHLPDIDGHALLGRLREEAGLHEVPAFLCTADDSPEVLDAALKAGFRGCWPKPVDAHWLRRELVLLNPALFA